MDMSGFNLSVSTFQEAEIEGLQMALKEIPKLADIQVFFLNQTFF
jgi:hypothetical protein